MPIYWLFLPEKAIILTSYPIALAEEGIRRQHQINRWIAEVLALMATQTPPPLATSNSPTLTVLR